VIEERRVYARMYVGEPATYRVERWDWKDSHIEEIVASANLSTDARPSLPRSRNTRARR
jgi:hypothetical protein